MAHLDDSLPNHGGTALATTSEPTVLHSYKDQTAYFMSGATQSYQARRDALLKLQAAMRKHETNLLEALRKDLRKHPSEGFLSEIGLIYGEINHMLAGLKRWMKPKRVSTPMSLAPARSYIVSEALGRVLVIAPWNYPIQLALNPVVGALAAGNVVTLKPSELTPHSSHAMAAMLQEAFDQNLVQVIEGGVEVSTALLEKPWDHIFFTGSTAVGKIVAQAAARHLSPCTLELGGKSPCIVTAKADIKVAARRIVYGKVLNSGQTCVAPDYLLVEKTIEKEFLKAVTEEITLRYGQNPLENPQLPKIVSDRHFQRLSAMITPEYVVHGGRTDALHHLIEPTLLLNVPMDHPTMREEIFGPLLPMLTYEKLDDALRLVKDRDHPLSLYIFSGDSAEQEKVMRGCRFGGGAINDTIMHLANGELPFGGVGQSGYGAYHGRSSFDCFVHRKSILKNPTWLDMPIRYAPWTSLKDRIIRFFLG